MASQARLRIALLQQRQRLLLLLFGCDLHFSPVGAFTVSDGRAEIESAEEGQISSI